MVDSNHTDDDPSDDCPESGERGPYSSHAPEQVECPDDSSAFWVHRCANCGVVFESYDTEQQYMENEWPEIQGGN